MQNSPSGLNYLIICQDAKQPQARSILSWLLRKAFIAQTSWLGTVLERFTNADTVKKFFAKDSSLGYFAPAKRMLAAIDNTASATEEKLMTETQNASDESSAQDERICSECVAEGFLSAEIQKKARKQRAPTAEKGVRPGR